METTKADRQSDRFPRWTLTIAGIYNLVWGMFVVLFPTLLFRVAEMEAPRYPQIWQCVGMIVGVYGLGYLIAATNPTRHWAIVLVGLVGKVLGPIGFVYTAASGALPWSWGLIILLNDLVWWLPFGYILYQAAKENTDTSVAHAYELEDAIELFPSQNGRTMLELSSDGPLMVVFLRHFGCSFCREALSDLNELRGEIEALGFRIALVHMSTPEEAEKVLNRYDLEGVHHFCDVQCDFYRAFGLKRGTASQLFGFRLWKRGIDAMLQGHTVGKLAGDGFRMPGVFFLHRGVIWGTYRHQTAADRPDYLELASQVRQVMEVESAAI